MAPSPKSKSDPACTLAALKTVEPGRCNGMSLRKATRRISQLYDAILAPSGLRATQRSILVHIERAGQLSMGELADTLVLDRSALAHNLKPLERDGLVKIIADPADRRARLVTVTARGRAKLEKSQPLWEQAQKSFEAAFGMKKAKALREALDLIASAEFAEAFARHETRGG